MVLLYIPEGKKKSTEGCQGKKRCPMIPYLLGTMEQSIVQGETNDQTLAMHSISTPRILSRLFRPDRHGHLSPDRDGT
jgi:hypothetical protein